MCNEECGKFLVFRHILGQFDAGKISLHFLVKMKIYISSALVPRECQAYSLDRLN